MLNTFITKIHCCIFKQKFCKTSCNSLYKKKKLSDISILGRNHKIKQVDMRLWKGIRKLKSVSVVVTDQGYQLLRKFFQTTFASTILPTPHPKHPRTFYLFLLSFRPLSSFLPPCMPPALYFPLIKTQFISCFQYTEGNLNSPQSHHPGNLNE